MASKCGGKFQSAVEAEFNKGLVGSSLPVGSSVKIDQGGGRFTFGVVEGFTSGRKGNSLGMRGNYTIRLTGGVDCFGRPAEPGKVCTVLYSNVRAA